MWRQSSGAETLTDQLVPAGEQLISAALVAKVTEYAEAAAQALAVADPWAAFVGCGATSSVKSVAPSA